MAGLANNADRSIVETVITLAHGLHIDVVAEGIETDEQRRLLKGLACDFGQGYLFARPVPAAEAALLLGSPDVASTGAAARRALTRRKVP